MIVLQLTAKEINIIVQAIRIAIDNGELADYGKRSEFERIKNKLQNVRD